MRRRNFIAGTAATAAMSFAQPICAQIDGRALGVQPGREEERRQREGGLAQRLRVVSRGDRVEVDDAEIRVAESLLLDVLAEAA